MTQINENEQDQVSEKRVEGRSSLAHFAGFEPQEGTQLKLSLAEQNRIEGSGKRAAQLGREKTALLGGK